jgi:allophanate hydrolase subunit 1
MENTTTNINDTVEVMTELTFADVQALEKIVNTCLDISLFTDESRSSLQELSSKLKKLSQDIEAANQDAAK